MIGDLRRINFAPVAAPRGFPAHRLCNNGRFLEIGY